MIRIYLLMGAAVAFVVWSLFLYDYAYDKAVSDIENAAATKTIINQDNQIKNEIQLSKDLDKLNKQVDNDEGSDLDVIYNSITRVYDGLRKDN